MNQNLLLEHLEGNLERHSTRKPFILFPSAVVTPSELTQPYDDRLKCSSRCRFDKKAFGNPF